MAKIRSIQMKLRRSLALAGIFLALGLGRTALAQNLSITYPSNNLQLYDGQSVNIVPKLGGYAPGQWPNCTAQFLPPGLELNPQTCAITGSLPLGLQAPPAGFTLPPITITSPLVATIDLAWTPHEYGIIYPSTSLQLYDGEAVNIVPKLTGLAPGQLPNCTAQFLPPGLELNPQTCAITGSLPLGLQAPPAGFTLPPITITSPLVATIDLAWTPHEYGIIYPSTSLQLYDGEAVNIVPKLTGLAPGQLPNCTAQFLPPGLELNPQTCAITGSLPLGLQAPPAGFTLPPITITSPLVATIDLAWTPHEYGIIYPSTSLQLYDGEAVNIVPKLTGLAPGQLPNCTAQFLPPGLELNPQTCAITGSLPLGLQAPPAGFTLPPITITSPLVATIDLAWTPHEYGIVYSQSTFNLHAGEKVVITPKLYGFGTQSAGCSLLAVLPPGLNLNPQTCEISGTLPPAVPSGVADAVSIQSPFVTTINLTINY